MITTKMIKELRELTSAGILDCKKALIESKGNIDKASDWLREKGISKAINKEKRIAAEGLCQVFIKDNKGVIIEVNTETDFVAKNDKFKNLVNSIGETLLNNDVNNLEEALQLSVGKETVNDLIIAKIAKMGEKISFRRFKILKKNDNDLFGSYIHMGGKIAVLLILDTKDNLLAKDIAMHIAAMKPLYIKRDDVPDEVILKEKEIIKEQALNEGKPLDIAEKMVLGRLNKFYKEICLLEQLFIKDDSLTIEDLLKNNNSSLKDMVRFEVGEGLEKRNDNFKEEVMNQINS